MQEQEGSSPKLARSKNNASSPVLPRDKVYLPSRYGLEANKQTPSTLTLLNSIELNAREEPKGKLGSPLKPHREPARRKDEPKLRPLRREESDLQNFQQIFLEPRQEALHHLQEKAKSEQVVLAKQVCRDYEKLLQFEKGHSPAHEPLPAPDQELGAHCQQAVELLAQPPLGPLPHSFYEEQIRVEPPETPNSSVASTLSPGAGYAPSVPLLPGRKGTLAELLMRAKAGMSTEDIQKEAHLAFYLGMAYEEMRAYGRAVRFYKRFLGFAKAMEDKVGMCLGANRVAVNLFYEGHWAKSIAFHHENLKLSDNENCFAAYYNLGVVHRALGQHEQSLACLETALEWARQRGEADSQCISLGQLAVTHRSMQLHQRAVEQFEGSAEICRRLRKQSLLAENLQQLLLISSHFGLSGPQKLLRLSEEAYETNKQLQLRRAQQQQGCNIGIIRGLSLFRSQVGQHHACRQCEQFGLEEEDTGQVEKGGSCPRGQEEEQDYVRQEED